MMVKNGMERINEGMRCLHFTNKSTVIHSKWKTMTNRNNSEWWCWFLSHTECYKCSLSERVLHTSYFAAVVICRLLTENVNSAACIADWIFSCRDPCAVLSLEVVAYSSYCNMVEWFWWDLSLSQWLNWLPSVLWYCWLGHLACKK